MNINCTSLDTTDEIVEVKDSLGYEKILGVYVFKPTKYQAERLGIDLRPVTLKITKDSLRKGNLNVYYGKFYLDKMILVLNNDKKDPYTSFWSLNYFKETKSNLFHLNQTINKNSDINFIIKKASSSDTLHIIGLADDPQHEVISIIDFKKIK